MAASHEETPEEAGKNTNYGHQDGTRAERSNLGRKIKRIVAANIGGKKREGKPD